RHRSGLAAAPRSAPPISCRLPMKAPMASPAWTRTRCSWCRADGRRDTNSCRYTRATFVAASSGGCGSMEEVARTVRDPAFPMSTAPLRIALVGCGAVARENLLPVLAGHDQLRLGPLVDRDSARARVLADAYGVETVLTDSDQLSRDTVDG